jgi:hypothetical protein
MLPPLSRLLRLLTDFHLISRNYSGIQNSGIRIQNGPHVSFQQFTDFIGQLDFLSFWILASGF